MNDSLQLSETWFTIASFRGRSKIYRKCWQRLSSSKRKLPLQHKLSIPTSLRRHFPKVKSHPRSHLSPHHERRSKWPKVRVPNHWSDGWRHLLIAGERRFVQIGSTLLFDKRFTSLSVGAKYFYIICRVFVAFSGQFSAYKNRKAHDLYRVFNGESWVYLWCARGNSNPWPSD